MTACHCIQMLPLLLIPLTFACRIDSNLHGTYQKQSTALGRLVFDNSLRDPIVFDDVVITATSISEFGECVQKSADAYIFALKRMGRAPCFRCVTPVMRAPNVLQLAHQQEDICHETANEAKMTCFDANLVGAYDGFLIFRSENTVETSCGLEGRFNVGYELKRGDLHCSVDGGTKGDSCDAPGIINIQFNNCTFPDFEMRLRCIGRWQERDGREMAIMFNDERGEYRCSVITHSGDDHLMHLSNDSSCASLTAQSAFETYTFRPESVTSTSSTCSFPEWLRGEYDSLSVSSSLIRYNGPGAAPVLARCVHVDGERILVHSRTKCGEELGFHCLWFRARSDSLIEYKTTIPTESASDEMCNDDGELLTAVWNTALVKQPTPSPCGIRGLFSTPDEIRSNDCYNVTVDCLRGDNLRIAAFNCKSGVIYDSRSYSCVASWRDEDQLFVYSTRAGQTHSCFILRYDGGRVFFASTGAHCGRGFNFTENADKTIVLSEQGNCSPPSTTARPKPARRPASSVTRIFPPPSYTTTTVVVTEITTTEEPMPMEQGEENSTENTSILWILLISLFIGLM